MQNRKNLKLSLTTWDWNDNKLTKDNWASLLPRATALIAALPLVANSDRRISPKQTISGWRELTKKETFVHNGELINWTTLANVMRYLTTSPRGTIMGGPQSTTSGIRWCAGVPLVLAAHKEFNGVLYENWDWTDPNILHFLDPDLREVANYREWESPFSLEELVEARTAALQINSGRGQGTTRDPKSCSTAYNLVDPRWKGIPRLVKLVLLQLWCWHPHHQSKFVIGGLSNWDNPSPPLVDHDVDNNLATEMLEEVWR